VFLFINFNTGGIINTNPTKARLNGRAGAKFTKVFSLFFVVSVSLWDTSTPVKTKLLQLVVYS
jgi:hypothetical protein